MMVFLYPELFVAVLIPSLILCLYLFSSKKRFVGVFSEEAYKKLSFESSSLLSRNVRIIMLLAAAFLMAMALARPVIDRGEREVVSKGSEIVIGLDISLSMDAKDIYPSRLEASVHKIKKLLEEVKSDKIAIVAFAEDSYVVSPMTKDKNIIGYLLENMDIGRFENRSSNMPAVIEAAKMLSSQEKRVLLILSDGDEGELKEIKEEASKNDIRVYAIGMAASDGVPIPDGKGGYINDSEGNIVISGLNPALEKLALSTGGAYTEHTTSNDDILALYSQIKSDVKAGEFEKDNIHDYLELFYFPLGVALILLLGAFHSLPARSGAAAVLLLAVLHTDGASASFDFEEMRNAKKEYKEGRFEEALKSYESIKGLDGNSEARRLYNMGNANYRLGDDEKAIENYEKSLELSDDPDTRHNLEMAKKRKEEKEKRSDQEKKDDQEKQDGDNKEDDKNRGENSQKEDDKKEQNDEKGDKGDKKEQGENSEQADKKEAKSAEEKGEQQMSDAEEKRWLKELDKKANPMPLKSIPVPKGGKNAKNW